MIEHPLLDPQASCILVCVVVSSMYTSHVHYKMLFICDVVKESSPSYEGKFAPALRNP